MKKTILIIIKMLIVLILTICIILAGNMFFYYPKYKKNKTAVRSFVPSDNEISLMSCNVRCFSPLDFGKKSWFYRAELVIKGIENNKPTIIGFQEVTKWHYSYLKESLPDYDSVISYRDNTFSSEGCPVFYRRDLYKLIDKNSFWLSETPDKMSKDWGAACYRICSYVILEDKNSGKQFAVFNTHLDHVSDEARINGINVVLSKIKQFGSIPSVIMGDFNADEESETYKSITVNFLDAKYQTNNTMSSCTYQNWGKELSRENIDYFMISKQGFNVNEYKVITDTFNGVYASDHFQIIAKLELQ